MGRHEGRIVAEMGFFGPLAKPADNADHDCPMTRNCLEVACTVARQMSLGFPSLWCMLGSHKASLSALFNPSSLSTAGN